MTQETLPRLTLEESTLKDLKEGDGGMMEIVHSLYRQGRIQKWEVRTALESCLENRVRVCKEVMDLYRGMIDKSEYDSDEWLPMLENDIQESKSILDKINSNKSVNYKGYKI